MKNSVLQPGRLIEVRPVWHEGFDNRPSFEILTMSSDRSNLKYDQRGDLYRAVLGDQVFFMYSDGKPTQGFGGRHIELTMLDGSVKAFQGGWSSNSAAVNKCWPDDPCIECAFTDSKVVWNEGRTFFSGAVKVRSLVRWYILNRCFIDWGLAIVIADKWLSVEPTKGRFVKAPSRELQSILVLKPFRSHQEELSSTYADRDERFFMTEYSRAATFMGDYGWNDGQCSSEQLHAVNA